MFSLGENRKNRAENRLRTKARSQFLLPSVSLDLLPWECPMAESFPVVPVWECERGAPMRLGTLGFAIPALTQSETALHRSHESHPCRPDPLPPTLCWTSPSARPIAECPADKPYRREA